MEIFEIHITADDKIHEVAKQHNHKTIIVDLLNPDKTLIRSEHMTSIISKHSSYDECKIFVDKIVQIYKDGGVEICRVKIECPIYDHYINQSIYAESHFETNGNEYAISRNQKKTVFLGTDREYNKENYHEFIDKHKGRDLELCLYDDNSSEDSDWLDLWNK